VLKKLLKMGPGGMLHAHYDCSSHSESILRELRNEATNDSLDRHGVYGAFHDCGLEDADGRQKLEPAERESARSEGGLRKAKKAGAAHGSKKYNLS
jgi:bacillopeptidase F (M6 metalloprotease family)